MANIQLVENLRRLRENRNYTQLQVSKKLNISRQAYSNYETGKRIPDIHTLVSLANIYGVTLEQLIAIPGSNPGALREENRRYYSGMVVETADTIYLTRDEVDLLRFYRNASEDDKRLAHRVLGSGEA